MKLAVGLLLMLPVMAATPASEAAARGIIHLNANRLVEARQEFERSLSLDAKQFESHFLLGAVLVEQHELSAAITHLRIAHKANPSHRDARKLLASQYVATAHPEEAIPLLAPIVNTPPLDAEIHLLLIEARQRNGDTVGAFALARQAASRFPKSAQIAAWLGFQLQFSGLYEEAKKALRRSLELDPSFPLSYQVLGEVYLKQENIVDALKWLRQAAEKTPDDAETLLSLSRALAAAGSQVEAIAILQRAAVASPRDARIRLQLSKLYFQIGDEKKAAQEAALSVELRESER